MSSTNEAGRRAGGAAARRPRRRRSRPVERDGDGPSALTFAVRRRVAFSEVDVMGVVWHGRYAAFFEEAAAALCRRCGLGYADFFEAGLRAPIIQFHIEYYRPLTLDEDIVVKASLVWTEAARLTIEYEVLKQDGSRAAEGYSVQLFVDSLTDEVCIASPDLWERCRRQWRARAFAELEARPS